MTNANHSTPEAESLATNEASMMLDVLCDQMGTKAKRKAKRKLTAYADYLETLASQYLGLDDNQRPQNVVRLRRRNHDAPEYRQQKASELVARATVARAVIARAFA